MERRIGRRGFLTALGILAAGAAVTGLDPDRALWVPGQKTHILPPAGGWGVQPAVFRLEDQFGVDFNWTEAAKVVNLNPMHALPESPWVVSMEYDKRMLESLRESLRLPQAYLEVPAHRIGETLAIRMPERYQSAFTSAHLDAKSTLR